MKKPTHDQIRKTALDLLSNYRQGARQSELWDVVLRVMSFEFHVDKNLVKNALWDLDTRFPDYVRKDKEAPRVVKLYPTSELLKTNSEPSGAEVGDPIIDEYEYDEEVIHYQSAVAHFTELYHTVRRLEEYATNKELFPMKLLDTDLYFNQVGHEDIQLHALIKKIYADLKQLSNLCEERYNKLRR